MELSWSTFVLEIINFLVLVWILKRFLYQPVLDVIARRRAGIEKTLTDAKALHDDAEKLQAQYESRLADWEQERQQAREKLGRELETERADKLAALQTELGQEQEKARVAEERRQADIRQKIEETAMLQAAEFATRLLEQAAGPELEARLVDLVIEELIRLPAERVTTIRNNYGLAAEAVMVITAFPLRDEQRQRLEQALATITDPDMTVRFEQNGELVAGVRIIIGAWILTANLRDELKGLVELAQGE